MASFPECPASLKQIQHYLKTAQEHDTRDLVVSYWCRLYALQVGLKLSSQQPDETKLLICLMDWLEAKKKELADNESVTNEVAAQAYLENYALKLFMYADKQDRESNFGKNVVKAFYTAGMIYDVLQTFGELTDEAASNRKYAKWKAAYIHNCLKSGETPVAGPLAMEGEEGEDEGGEEPSSTTSPEQPPPEQPMGFNMPNIPDDTNFSVIADKLPSPPVDPEKPPGGFQAYIPAADPSTYVPPTPVENVNLSAEQITKASKYCKWAASSLQYDDIKTAVENLQKALKLLQTGVDS